MNTNLRKTVGQITLGLVITLVLVVHAARAQAQGGVPLWTNRYNGPGNGHDAAYAIAVDSSDNVFVTGSSDRNGNGFSTNLDVATIKYSSAGVPLWTNRHLLAGPFPFSVVVDSSDRAFVGGTIGGRFETIAYSSTGTLLWTNVIYDSVDHVYDDRPAGLAVDHDGNVIITGSLVSNYCGCERFVTIKYSGAGMPLWTNFYSGPTNSAGFGSAAAGAVAVDSAGDVFVTGNSSGEYTEVVTIKYSSAGVPLWTNRFGSISLTQTGLAVDGNGTAFMTGSSDGGYVTVAYSSAGVPLWTNRYLGTNYQYGHAAAVAVDSRGNVFVTGYASISDPCCPVIIDFATVAYSGAGVPLWTNRYDGPAGGSDTATALAVDTNGTVFVTGSSKIPGFGRLNAGFATVAYSFAGVPLWTNRYDDVAPRADPRFSEPDGPRAIAVDRSGNVVVTGFVTATNGFTDFLTIKYSPTVVPPHLAIARDGGGGLFIRIASTPDVTYRLQRAASVTGPWSNLATNTAPASGLIEFHETSPPPGQAFYRTAQP